MIASALDTDLSVTKTDNEISVPVGTVLTYALTVGNAGADDASAGDTVVDTLPVDVTVNGGAAGAVTLGGANAADWSCTSDTANPQEITCTSAAVLTVGGSSVFSFDTDVLAASLAGTTVTNSATVSPAPGETDSNAANDTGTDDTDVTAAADLSITKVDGTDPIEQANFLTYTLQVTNAGPSTAVAVVVTDVLDADTSYVSDTAGCVEAPAGGAASGLVYV